MRLTFACLFILLIFKLCFSLAWAEKILFAPLPYQPKETLLGNHYPLINYLRNKTGLPIELHYERDYRALIEAFKAGKIPLITFGPLPYYVLKKEFPKAKALVYIRESGGADRYSCVLVTTIDGPKSVKEIKGPIAVTQKLSTCGYFSANILLSKHGKNIHKLGFAYFDTHNEVVEAVLKGRFEAGTLKREVAEKYQGFAIRILEETPKWPAFSIIANTEVLSQEVLNKIKEALIKISPDEAKKLIVGRYGFSEASEKDFEIIRQYEKFLPSF